MSARAPRHQTTQARSPAPAARRTGRVRHFRIPRLAQMLQIPARRLHGRNFRDAFGRVERQDGRRAIDARRATARISPKPPAGWPLRRRVSAPGPRQRKLAIRPKAAQWSRRENRRIPAGTRRTAAAAGPALHLDLLIAGFRTATPEALARISALGRVSKRAIRSSQIDSDDVLAWQSWL